MPITSLSPSQGLQSFIDNASNTMVATSTVGTPAAGQFYSSVVGRASMVDLSKDMKPRMAIERIMVVQAPQLQNEFGPNGEPVLASSNDSIGQIRFVGGGWASVDSQSGVAIYSNFQNDYIEVTFYGTGLNYITQVDTNSRDNRYAVDGGSYSANIYPTGGQGVLNNRFYGMNVVLPVVNNLAIGVHTVQINNNLAANGLTIYGIEVVNESSSVKVNQGAGYVGGQKLSLAAQSSFSYSAPVTGARGGRALIYQNGDSTIGQTFNPVGSTLTGTSTDHTNEEVVRTYSWAEFGCGRSDDFAVVPVLSNVNAALTLNDGTTSLNGFAITQENQQLAFNGNTAFVVISFVGTGLDIMRQDNTNGGSDNYTAQIDGGTTVTLSATGSTILRKERIVSGLPYGQHNVRITRVTASTFRMRISQFIVYQPKKPSLPSGAVELADYNVMASIVANTTQGQDTVGAGVLWKSSVIEFAYSGSGWSAAFSNSHATGWRVGTSTSGDFVEYTFFGTGFELKTFTGGSDSTTVNMAFQNLTAGGALLNATTGNFPTLLAATYGGSFSTSTGIANFSGGSQQMGVTLYNLPLALYKIRLTNNAALLFQFSCINPIVPIHSYKSNLYYDVQNTLPVGSCGISDNRALTPVKDVLPATKAWAQTFGVTNNPSSSSSSFVPMPDMSVTIKTSGGPLRIIYNATITNSTSGAGVNCIVFVDGVSVGQPKTNQESTASYQLPISDSVKVPVPAGTHKVDVYWTLNGGSTITALGVQRNLLVEET